ncbi:hypothetical protein BV22DRAFT_1130097 [Leucogyrophana mollusca]|uniref:Uncharacterized protein n=1 Tax=Leucogyrophana mollusca TaxID=85980 RepID=A0ACB8BFZ2_9AGAM|nr:hypothetical protein BV22DRAFT_1130097 [Leucogyrophana mollusca]
MAQQSVFPIHHGASDCAPRFRLIRAAGSTISFFPARWAFLVRKAIGSWVSFIPARRHRAPHRTPAYSTRITRRPPPQHPTRPNHPRPVRPSHTPSACNPPPPSTHPHLTSSFTPRPRPTPKAYPDLHTPYPTPHTPTPQRFTPDPGNTCTWPDRRVQLPPHPRNSDSRADTHAPRRHKFKIPPAATKSPPPPPPPFRTTDDPRPVPRGALHTTRPQNARDAAPNTGAEKAARRPSSGLSLSLSLSLYTHPKHPRPLSSSPGTGTKQ